MFIETKEKESFSGLLSKSRFGFEFAALITVLGLGVLVWLVSSNLYVEKARESNRRMADTISQTLQEMVKLQVFYAEHHAGLEVPVHKFVGFYRGFQDSPPRLNILRFRGMTRAFVCDPSGIERFDFPEDPTVIGKDFSFRDWFKGVNATKKTYVSEAYLRAASPRIYLVAIATPIFDTGGEVLGYLVTQYALDDLSKRIRDISALEEDILLFDHRGNLLTGHEGDTPRSFSGIRAFEILRKGPPNDSLQNHFLTGKPAFMHLKEMGNPNWTLIVLKDRDLVLADRFALFFKLICGLVLALLPFYLYGRLALRKFEMEFHSQQYLDDEKKRFLWAAAGELRNSIIILNNQIDLLRELGVSGKDLKKEIQNLESSCGQIALQFENLVLVSGMAPLDSGGGMFRQDICAILKNMEDSFGRVSSAYNVSVVLKLEGNPLWVVADKAVLSLALENILHVFIQSAGKGSSVIVERHAQHTLSLVFCANCQKGEIDLPRLLRWFEKELPEDLWNDQMLWPFGLKLRMAQKILQSIGLGTSLTLDENSLLRFALQIPAK